MVRLTNDPSHSQLRAVLQDMLDRDETITARGAVRLHPILKSPSDITRNLNRRSVLQEFTDRQIELRTFAGRVRHSGVTLAAQALQAAEERIRELEGDEEARLASHVAMIRAVCELGGTAKLQAFYGQFAEIRNRLVQQRALPIALVEPLPSTSPKRGTRGSL